MARTARPVRLDPDLDLAGLELHPSELLSLRELLRELLAQRAGGTSERWRQSILQGIRALTRSDKGLLLVRTASGIASHALHVSPDLVSRYVHRFSDLDRSRVAAREYGLEVWSIDQLWRPGELERSQYYQSFAAPNHLHCTVGLTLQLASPRAEICLLLHQNRPEAAGLTQRRRDLLHLLLEPIRAGFAWDLAAADPSAELSSLLDVTGQALALYGIDGRELAQNPVMRRVLAQEEERSSLEEQIRGVAKSVLACIAKGVEPRDRSHRQNDGTRREVATARAAYRLRGNLVGRNTLGHGTAVVVSLDRVAFQVPAPDSIRARYGLTLRELQVASLLMHRLSNAEIARMLGISPHTARHHTENVLAKFGVQSRQALRRAITEIPSG